MGVGLMRINSYVKLIQNNENVKMWLHVKLHSIFNVCSILHNMGCLQYEL